MNQEDYIPNERLRRARNLKGWSQAELAEQVGTSFEMVSRWERGVTLPSHYYRERLSSALSGTADELGLIHNGNGTSTLPPSSLVFLASSHVDAEKEGVSSLKLSLQERGFALWDSRHIVKQGGEHSRTALREAIRAAEVILVILSPDSHSSRHVRETLELAGRYMRPVYGVWMEGENWRECLPKGSGELTALIDARGKDTETLTEEMAAVLKSVESASPEVASPDKAPDALLAVSPLPTLPAMPGPRKGFARSRAVMLVGLAVLVVAGGVLGSFGLLAHFGVIGARNAIAGTPVRGGSWTDEFNQDIDSLIPNAGFNKAAAVADQALYLPLFYGDAQGVMHPGAAIELPTVKNGGISKDARTWTFHLRPHLVWTDGQPYDARDVDFTWKLWLNPTFGAASTGGYDMITSATVSADHLSITFHLKQTYVPFLTLWVDGFLAPLPAHEFSGMAAGQIVKSPDNLFPTVTSGAFMMSESVPGDHFTMVRSPRFYRASEGLPYLDRVVFRIASDANAVLSDLQAGSADSSWFLDIGKAQEYQKLRGYQLTSAPTSNSFEALHFNFHNTILATHLEVREAMAYAIDQQALIKVVPLGLAGLLCTDHSAAYHPGYEIGPPCPVFDVGVANKLLDDNGWVRGTDGVRVKNGQRLEFEYSTLIRNSYRLAVEAFLQGAFGEIGIKLDIQNYLNYQTFFPLLNAGKASPPTGAVAGRYDIAEIGTTNGYDPNDSSMLACNQISNGNNLDFYCNPALDALYQQELTTPDPGERQQIFIKIHRIYLTEFPIIVLYSIKELAVVRNGTHNYQPSPFEGETVNIWEWWCDHGKC